MICLKQVARFVHLFLSNGSHKPTLVGMNRRSSLSHLHNINMIWLKRRLTSDSKQSNEFDIHLNLE